jgi:hypothetical protein
VAASEDERLMENLQASFRISRVELSGSNWSNGQRVSQSACEWEVQVGEGLYRKPVDTNDRP